jgi:Fur family zinc uptake transcriptional regulator
MNLDEESKTGGVDGELDHAEKKCKGSGKRLTNKRKQVLTVLLKLNRAASAYEVLNCYEQTFGEALPIMSIYRILDFLEQAHLAHKLQLASKYVACSHIRRSTKHEFAQFFICSGCDKVKEVTITPETFDELKRSSVDAGFEIEVPQLEINCVCIECR